MEEMWVIQSLIKYVTFRFMFADLQRNHDEANYNEMVLQKKTKKCNVVLIGYQDFSMGNQ